MHEHRGVSEQQRRAVRDPARAGQPGLLPALGYLGAAEAQQYGFRVPPGSALSALGIDTSGADADPATLPQAEQAAIGMCATIVADFTEAQIATAVTDAGCTLSTDLAGIYFAVLASYEQQIVNANATALTDAVRQFRAALGAELRKLPGLLKTTSVRPYPQVQGGQSVKPGQPTSAAG